MMQWRLLFHHFWLFHLPSLSRTQRDRPEISKCVVELGALGVVKVLHIFELSQKLGDQHIFVLLLYFFSKSWRRNFHGCEWMPSSVNWWITSSVEYILLPSSSGNRIFVAFLVTNVLDGMGWVKVWHCEWLWTSISKCFYCVKVKFHGGASRWKIETGFHQEYAYTIWCKWSGQPLNLCLCILSFESRKFIIQRQERQCPSW